MNWDTRRDIIAPMAKRIASLTAELAAVKAERDAAVERGERLEWLVEVQDLALVMVEECNNGPWNPSYMELRASYKAARAAVEGK